MIRGWFLLCLFVWGTACAWAQPAVIAHRGAPGYVPEHTNASYAMAYAMGADYIEQDLVMSKDGVLLCLHDRELDDVTNVAEVSPGRAREDGKFYAADFTVDEIKSLHVTERWTGRFPQGKGHFVVITLAESIELVQGLNEVMGRDIGIYPELKFVEWHAEQGFDMEAELLRVLSEYGYEGPDANVFVQCFEAAPLKRMREELGSTLPQVQLIADRNDFRHMVEDEGLDEIAAYAQGIGPSKNYILRDPSLVERAHERGLVLHPYTVRADDLPGAFEDHADEVRTLFVEHGIDGVFTDQPDQTLAVLKEEGLR